MATAQEVRSKLIGSWSLIESRTELRDKPTDEPFILYTIGQDAQGTVIFSPDGYVATQLMRPGAIKWASDNLLAGTPEELADTARHFLAYAGTFDVEINEQGEALIWIQLNLSSFPNWLGDRQQRAATFKDGVLTLKSPSFELQVILLPTCPSRKLADFRRDSGEDRPTGI
ncbi:Lipocalin-like domain-containing protein [Immersiella caudata]|uniref:Lipocalin-like domain-containing protein n=1 Tax=Immersiella caudata TaxID=314043 RepID=A0AA39TSQ3_9PEZI|nr:Lipocalin-like domain-containing protein [Immersiella caudata]